MTALIVEERADKVLENNDNYVWTRDVCRVLKWDNCLNPANFRADSRGKNDISQRERNAELAGKLRPVLEYMYAKHGGEEVFAGGIYRHADREWMAAGVGGWIVTDCAEYILECYVCINTGEPGGINLSDRYWAELQHIMEVSCADRAVVLCMAAEEGTLEALAEMTAAGGGIESAGELAAQKSALKFEIIEVERDETFIRQLLLAEERWLLQGREVSA